MLTLRGYPDHWFELLANAKLDTAQSLGLVKNTVDARKLIRKFVTFKTATRKAKTFPELRKEGGVLHCDVRWHFEIVEAGHWFRVTGTPRKLIRNAEDLQHAVNALADMMKT